MGVLKLRGARERMPRDGRCESVKPYGTRPGEAGPSSTGITS